MKDIRNALRISVLRFADRKTAPTTRYPGMSFREFKTGENTEKNHEKAIKRMRGPVSLSEVLKK